MERKKRLVIIGNTVKLTKVYHPDEAKKNKDWICELFLNDVSNSKLISKTKGLKSIYSIEIEGIKYNFSFDTTDSGGRVDSRKISIPYASKDFRTSLENEENIL